ncbi:hypothetical protein OBBRIDRAFT_787649 [Obba rivulosa]|uniref:t-SNARE coiled-coil homology domain-containing protein n=1 Tax=Obba rivulosa TaxID=1052685 RepID=A0A8E2DUP8_9APHY|nr:hypothetical protein OBBRIDRAFT_787649 [Obba rivulosa]
MSFFKRKDKNIIPPVQSEQVSRDGGRSNTSTPLPSYRSASSTYVASRDGDPYNGSSVPPPSSNSYSDRYTKKDAVGDVYARGRGDVDKDRSELFSGYNPEKSGSGRFFNDGAGAARDLPAEEGNDEDVEGIKQSMRFTKQESLSSTRNALRLAREAEETARGTVGRLGDQSEKLANTERHLDVSKGHQQRAEDKTDELKKLNRSIFRPAITFNKDAKRAAQEEKIQQRYEEERMEREEAMRDIRDTQDRLGRATTYGRPPPDEEGIGGRRQRTAAEQGLKQEQRKRYQFEATASDDELEDELDDNLDEISRITKNLKALGSAMGQELDTQNERITRITDKTDKLDNQLFRNTQKLNRIK